MKNELMLTADYHTHTVYSRNGHGKGTIEENVRAAVKRGLQTVGISDHGPGHLFYGIKRKNFQEVRREIERLKKIYDIEILFGVEANIVSYDGEIDIDTDDRKYLDYVNLGFHNGVGFKNISSLYKYGVRNFFGKFGRKIHDKAVRDNTRALILAIEQNDIFYITHPGDKIDIDIGMLSDACERTGTMLEINEHHPHLNEKELKIASEYDVKFVIGSDAHRPEDIGVVDSAMERLINSGVNPDRVLNVKER